VGQLRVPTLVVHGTADRIVPSARGAELARLIPDAHLHLIDGAGHNYLTDETAEANRLVSEFLRAHDEEPSRVTP
jgi:pimeloyl-ACP methyl ester carboxylesterase